MKEQMREGVDGGDSWMDGLRDIMKEQMREGVDGGDSGMEGWRYAWGALQSMLDTSMHEFMQACPWIHVSMRVGIYTIYT